MPGHCLVLFTMLLALTILILLLSAVYGRLISRFLMEWRAIPLKEPTHIEAFPTETRPNSDQGGELDPSDAATWPTVSVLIPARNEAATIGTLLTALQTQQYPASLLEIIVIDDHSEDETAAIVQTFNGVILLSLQETGINSYKKKALEKAVGQATGELIVCTDADCIPGPHWIAQLASCYKTTQAKFIAAPVLLLYKKNGLGYLQALDFMILQGITGAGLQSGKLLMANGANMAYPRSVFSEVNGYAGADHIASGDDLFLLHKISDRYATQLMYLKSKEAIVSTPAQESWGSFFQQRIRWASKSTHYKKGRLQAVLLLVGTYNLLLLLAAIGGLFDIHFLFLFLLGCCLKAVLEWDFVKEVAIFFDSKHLLKIFIWLQPLHILYTVIAGMLGLKGGYRWKGRIVR